MGRVEQALQWLHAGAAPRKMAPHTCAAKQAQADLPWPGGQPTPAQRRVEIDQAQRAHRDVGEGQPLAVEPMAAPHVISAEQPPGVRPIKPVFVDDEPAADVPTVETAPNRDLVEKPEIEQESKLVDALLAELTPGVPLSLALGTVDVRDEADAVLAHIARSLASRRLGKVLVIGAQFRRDALAARLCAARPRGLADILAGHVPWEAAIETTNHEHMRWIGPGRMALDEPPPQIEAMSHLFAQLKRHFRFVLVDAGRLDRDETRQVASACDGVYVVVDPLRGDRRAIDRTLVDLSAAGSLVLGCIALDENEIG